MHLQIDVLKDIGCIDADLVVQIKGRVACEMNSGEELICTECLFENQLDDLEPEEAVALMSAFVFQQKNTSEPSLTRKLSQAKKRLVPPSFSPSSFSLYLKDLIIRFLAVLGRLLPIIVCCGCIGLDDRSVALPLLGDHCGGFCIIFFGDSHEFANSEFILASGMYGRSYLLIKIWLFEFSY